MGSRQFKAFVAVFEERNLTRAATELFLTRPTLSATIRQLAVTIEPSLYFIGMLLDEVKARGLGDSIDWSRVDLFRPYGGIRIESDVVCTEPEPEDITRDGFAAR